MQRGKLYRSIPASVIFLSLGALILPVTVLIGQNIEGWSVLLLISGLYVSTILFGVGIVLGIIDLLKAHRN